MEWSTLGCPIGNTPACCYSPEGGPVDKASPANLHIPSLILLLNWTGQLPAFFVVHKIKFTVVNKNSQQIVLDKTDKNCDHNDCDGTDKNHNCNNTS